MASLSTQTKFSLRYVSKASLNDDSLARTISGLNVSGGTGSPDSGPNRDTAITYLIGTLNSFSTVSISNVRWISEQEVVI